MLPRTEADTELGQAQLAGSIVERVNTMAPLLNSEKYRARMMADKMDVVANIVRNKVENDINARDLLDGVRLSHEEFLYLYEHAKRSMYEATKLET